MRKKILRPITLLMTLVILLSLVLSACTPAATPTGRHRPADTGRAALDPGRDPLQGSAGAAGYEVEICSARAPLPKKNPTWKP
jgi:hypothetical protein